MGEIPTAEVGVWAIVQLIKCLCACRHVLVREEWGMMGRWCEEDIMKWRWREGRVGSHLVSLDTEVLLSSWPSSFLPLFFCLFICLLVCFLHVLSWMKCLVAVYGAQRHGGLKAKRILHLLSALPHLLLLTGYLLLLLFWQADLSSSHSSSSITHLSPFPSLNFSPSFGNFTAFYLSGQRGWARGWEWADDGDGTKVTDEEGRFSLFLSYHLKSPL